MTSSAPCDVQPTEPTLFGLVTSVWANRLTGLPPWVVLTQVFIGLGWIRAGVEKVIEPAWWSGDLLHGFLSDHDGLMLEWYEPVVEIFLSPYAVLVAGVVAVLQLGVGLSLVSGRFIGGSLVVGMFLNLNFVAAGAVNPSVFYLLSQGALVLWLAEGAGSDWARQLVVIVAVVASALGIASLPFVATLQPAEVIDDPALMFSFGGFLTVMVCDLVHRRLTGGEGLP